MKSNLRRRLAAAISAALLAGSLSVVVAPAVLAATDPGCTALGGDDTTIVGTCQVSGTVAVTGTITVKEHLHLLAGAHLDATESATGFTLIVGDPVGPPVVIANLTMDLGSLIEGDDRAGQTDGTGGRDLTINVTGNAYMAAGSRISSDNNITAGTGGEILIDVDGDMTMKGTDDPAPPFNHCRNAPSQGDGLGFYNYLIFGTPDVIVDPTLGAVISAHRYGASNSNSGGHIAITVGNYGVPPSGTFIMERCSLVDVSSRGSAGQIEITAGKVADIDGLVLSESGQSGVGNAANVPRGGGPIDVRAGCNLSVSDTGVISSKGQDPGADLVHLKGCEVVIEGIVQSTAPGAGHVLPRTDGVISNLCNRDPVAHPLTTPNPAINAEGFTACVRILGQNVTVNAVGAHNGNVNTDGIRAPMRTWIDIFTTLDTTILGDPVGSGVKWAVSANACPPPANTPCSNAFGGIVTIKAVGGKVHTEGQAILQANSTAGGGDGGILTIQAGGNGPGTPAIPNPTSNIELDSSFIEANGTLAGTNEAGGIINIKSFNGKITSDGSLTGHIQALGGHAAPPVDTRGVITLEECANVDSYLGTVSANTINEIRSICGGNPTLPNNGPWDAQALLDANAPIWLACVFQAAQKTGMKFNDVDNSGSKTAGDTPLANWPINLLDGANALIDTTTTAADGSYAFVIPAPGTYKVCEGVGPLGFTQTYPNAGTPSPTPGDGELIVSTCPVPNTWGYQFVVGANGGEVLEDNDFGNFRAFDCPEDRVRTPLITRTVGNPSAPVPNYATLQLAYDAAKATNKAEVIGMFSQTVENVVLDNYIGPSMMITQCTTAKITALDANAPVWHITSTKKLTIIGPDSVGGTIGWLLTNQNSAKHDLKSIRSNGASVAGVRIALGSNANTVSFNNVASAGIGVDVLSNGNVLKAGTIGPSSSVATTGTGVHFGPWANNNKISGSKIQKNSANGVWIEGYSNTVESNDVLENGPNGILVTRAICPPSPPVPPAGSCHASSGSSNTIKSNQIDSNGDGINVTGLNNTIQDNKVSKNKADGIEIAAGSGNKLKGNASNNGSPGGSSENLSVEYRFGVVIVNQGNKKDGANFTTTAIGAYE